MSAGGKATFYIVPLQETLDTSPLPPDSQHFSKMPKKTCYQCNEVMPLQMLAVHIKTCKGKLSSDETGDEVRANCFCFLLLLENDKKNVNCLLKLCFVHLQSSDEICFVENKCKVNLANN